MADKDSLPEKARRLVESIGVPITTDEVEVYARVQDIQERLRRVKVILNAWSTQQKQDRAMRGTYARWLMILLTCQIVLINLVFVLIGFGGLTVEEWTVKTFILAVFLEVAALTLLVVKYLFTPPSDKILDLLDPRNKAEAR